jgi:hypothetical protein
MKRWLGIGALWFEQGDEGEGAFGDFEGEWVVHRDGRGLEIIGKME